jgi:hypothetical protein
MDFPFPGKAQKVTDCASNRGKKEMASIAWSSLRTNDIVNF